MAFLRSNRRASLSDSELIDTYRSSGDMEWLSRLYERYMDRVYGLCLKYLKEPEESKDAVMQIFSLLADKLLSQEVEHFKAWLYTVARNHCLSQIRRNNRTLTKEKEALFVYSDRVFHPDNAGHEDALRKLEMCMQRLSDKQRICIDRFYTQKQSYEAIANALGLTWNSVRSHIQNGRRNLKKCMDNE